MTSSELTVVKSAAEAEEIIGASFWRSAGFYSSPTWWRAVELMRPEVDIRYLCSNVIEQQRALMPSYYYDPGRDGDPYATNWWTTTPLWAGQSARDPWAIVGGCSGLYGGPIGSTPLSVGLAVADLIPKVTEYNRSIGFNTIFPYFSEEIRDALADALEVTPHSFPLYGVHAVLDINFRTFEEYLEALPSQSRSIARRDRRRFAASKFRLVKCKLSESLLYLPGLWDNVEIHHGAAPNLEQRRAMLRSQADAADDVAHVFTVLDSNDKPVASSLNFVDEYAIYCRIIGMDYAPARESGAYFEVMYYANIEFALKQGYQRIYFGSDALKAKLVRGAHLEPLFSLFEGMRGERLTDCAAESIKNGIQSRLMPQLAEASSSTFQFPDYLK